jgi:hypothetical protein
VLFGRKVILVLSSKQKRRIVRKAIRRLRKPSGPLFTHNGEPAGQLHGLSIRWTGSVWTPPVRDVTFFVRVQP